ncbi:hypothetical protein M0802_004635 [Mischocyttarus mexicanus]|nr:hypothetical protein M0802_004635 [Mischocyttarus mexicanus]
MKGGIDLARRGYKRRRRGEVEGVDGDGGGVRRRRRRRFCCHHLRFSYTCVGGCDGRSSSGVLVGGGGGLDAGKVSSRSERVERRKEGRKE